MRASRCAGADGARARREFEQLLLIAHYSALRVSTVQSVRAPRSPSLAARFSNEAALQGLKEIAARVAVSLLRYTADVPADRAFHDAALLCRETSQESLVRRLALAALDHALR